MFINIFHERNIRNYFKLDFTATKAQSKEMLPVYDKSTILYVVEEAIASGIDDIIIITSKQKNQSKTISTNHMNWNKPSKRQEKDRKLKQIRKITNLADCYVRQKKQKDLGDAIRCGQRHIGREPFAVLLGDSITRGPTPCTKQLIDVYEKYNSSTISLEEVHLDNVERYGIISGQEVEKNIYKIDELVEKPPKKTAPSNPCNHGQICTDTRYF